MAQLLAQRLTRFNCLKYVYTVCSIKIHFSNVLNQTSGCGGWRDSLPVWLVSSRKWWFALWSHTFTFHSFFCIEFCIFRFKWAAVFSHTKLRCRSSVYMFVLFINTQLITWAKMQDKKTFGLFVAGEPGECGEGGPSTGGQHDPPGRQPAPD